MKHLKAFEDALGNIHSEGRYRVFIDLQRHKGHEKEAALLFTSGYVSNDATLSTLGKIMKDLIIYSDQLNHA